MKYVLPFAFKNESGNRTTHYLIFVSKDIKGYSIMTEIMGKCSSCYPQGVPSFEYNPALLSIPLLIHPEDPLKTLKRDLRKDFQGQTITMEKVYEIHQIHVRPYLKRNYKKALLELEEESLIITNRAQRKTRAGKFPDDIVITFPPGNQMK